MTVSSEDLESYLTRLERKWERVAEGTYLVRVAPNQPPAALRIQAPLFLIQVSIAAVPDGDTNAQARLFRSLLELNATDLVHASYGIEDDTVVLSAAQELSTLDLVELETVLADFDLALLEHVPRLRELTRAS